MISEVMKEIARGCIGEEVNAAVVFGTVTAESPAAVRVEDRLVLDDGVLVIPKELKRREVPVTVGDGVQSVVVSPGLRAGDKAVILHLGDCWLLAGTID